jgi:hypothetical protein
MNAPYFNVGNQLALVQKKEELVKLLDAVGRELELSDAQHEQARSRYEAVGDFLASQGGLLAEAKISPQGSVALGTTTKPINTNEFDVDLICLLPNMLGHTAAEIKAAVRNGLLASPVYARMLIEKNRCWRLDYANQFHLDITPAVLNLHCTKGGLLVPDRENNQLKPTNPKGYANRFNDYYAKLTPTFSAALRHKEFSAMDESLGHVEAYPERQLSKPILNRIVQLLKRHRDVFYAEKPDEYLKFAPISIVITTLAAKSYEWCVKNEVFSSGYDLIVAVIKNMRSFINVTRNNSGNLEYSVENETTRGENFAERWNDDPRFAGAFYEWHNFIVDRFESLPVTDGLDAIGASLQETYRLTATQRSAIVEPMIQRVNSSRNSGRLYATSSGVSVASAGILIPKNTFFGA